MRTLVAWLGWSMAITFALLCGLLGWMVGLEVLHAVEAVKLSLILGMLAGAWLVRSSRRVC